MVIKFYLVDNATNERAHSYMFKMPAGQYRPAVDDDIFLNGAWYKIRDMKIDLVAGAYLCVVQPFGPDINITEKWIHDQV